MLDKREEIAIIERAFAAIRKLTPDWAGKDQDEFYELVGKEIHVSRPTIYNWLSEKSPNNRINAWQLSALAKLLKRLGAPAMGASLIEEIVSNPAGFSGPALTPRGDERR